MSFYKINFLIRRDWVGKGSTLSLGDPMVLLYAICTAERLGSTEELCASIGVRPKALSEIRKLRKQLCSEVEVILKGNLSSQVLITYIF